MSVRRLAEDAIQPDQFKFNRANASEAKNWIKKYPKGRQASAVIPLLHDCTGTGRLGHQSLNRTHRGNAGNALHPRIGGGYFLHAIPIAACWNQGRIFKFAELLPACCEVPRN